MKKSVMSWGSQKKESIFWPEVIFFNICVLSPQCMYSVLNNLSEYIATLLHIKKHYFIHFCCLFLKSLKAFSVSIRFEAINLTKKFYKANIYGKYSITVSVAKSWNKIQKGYVKIYCPEKLKQLLVIFILNHINSSLIMQKKLILICGFV